MPRMKCFVHLISIAACFGATAIAAAPLIGCGGTVTPAQSWVDAGAPSLEVTADSSPPGAGTGSIDAVVQLPAGESVSTASYRLSGPSGFVQSGALDFIGSQAIAFDIASVPASVGTYTLEIAVGSVILPTACTGSASFVVVANETTRVNIVAQCSATPTAAPSASVAPSQSATSAPPPSPPPPQVVLLGSVGVVVQIPRGVSIASLECELRGPGGLSLNDVLNVENNSTVPFIIDNLPAGDGYKIALSGASSDGSESCSVASTFDVVGEQKTETTLVLRCQGVDGGALIDGGVLIDGGAPVAVADFQTMLSGFRTVAAQASLRPVGIRVKGQ
jgi:hypothetical protein